MPIYSHTENVKDILESRAETGRKDEGTMFTMEFVVLGYLSGSVLYARVFAKLFGKEKLMENSRDRNPGTANAFVYGGFWCGLLTLICDILKGFVPVFLYMFCSRYRYDPVSGLTFVLAAPVVGHAFPLFYKWKGGKGIATTFGCLLGLLPTWQPAAVLAVFFIFFSVVLRVTPHFHRTLLAYFCALLCMACIVDRSAILGGFIIITVFVCIRMYASPEEKEKMRIKFLWMH